MVRYASISVPVEAKRYLEKAKGEKSWGKFFFDLHNDHCLSKSKNGLNELTKVLSEADLQAMEKSSREFRKKFALQ